MLTQHGTAYSGSARSDLIACVRGRFLAVEVKMPGGTYRPGQREFLRTVRRTGGFAFTARSVGKTAAMIDLLEAYMAQTTELTLEELMAQLESTELESTKLESTPSSMSLAQVVAATHGDPQAEIDDEPGGYTPTPVDDATVDELTLEFEREREEMERQLANVNVTQTAAPTNDSEKLDQLLVLVDDLAQSVRRLVDSMGTSAAPQRAPRKARVKPAVATAGSDEEDVASV